MGAGIVGEVLGTIVVLSLLFEWRPILDKNESRGVDEPIAVLVSLVVIYAYNFDALAIMFKEAKTSWLGFAVTAGIIASGSKESLALFRDYLGWTNEAYKDAETKRRKVPSAPTDATPQRGDAVGKV